jgi:predicted ATPase
LGLDGLLIGLRTRELLQQLLEARCRLSSVVMLIEDLHWIDSVSGELLNKIIDSEAKLRLLLLTTRRPEYAPPWLNRTVVTKLSLEPLPVGHVRRLIQARLGVDVLPEALARQVAEKAEGNPLFVEEIVSYLTERGIIRTTVESDASALTEALPLSAACRSARSFNASRSTRAVSRLCTASPTATPSNCGSKRRPITEAPRALP